MANCNEGKHVSEVIDYDRDIRGHHLIRISAGVGAGKNYWTEELAKQGYRVLLITSRAITAEAQAQKLHADRWIDIDRLIDSDDSWGSPAWNAQAKVVCTNAHIEKFIKKRYDPDNPKTHIWNKFDFIILDEAHSLACDATFAESPFYVERFLKYAYKHNPDCHIILMSGTQDPIDWLFSGAANQQRVHVIDLFQTCAHLEPDIVRYFPTENSINMLLRYWEKGQRTIYFANSIRRIAEIVASLKMLGIPESDIGVSYSDEERDNLFSDFLVKRNAEINESLALEEHVPTEVKIFLSTTKNKEGINIMDEDIKTIFAESHQRSELIQMAGRVRKGLEELCVVFNAPEHESSTTPFIAALSKNCLEGVRKTFSDYQDRCKNRNRPFNAQAKIAHIEKIFPCIRYDPLTEDFYEYKGRRHGESQKYADSTDLHTYLDYLDWPISDEWCGCTGREMLEQWFPYSKTEVYELARPIQDFAKEELRAFLQEHNLLNTTFYSDSQPLIAEKILRLIALYGTKNIGVAADFKSLRPALKKFDLSFESVGKHGAGMAQITELGEKK